MKWFQSKVGWILASLYIIAVPVSTLFTTCPNENRICPTYVSYLLFNWKWLKQSPDIPQSFYFIPAILINAIILYLIGYGIEKLIRKRKTQPPNQGQPPKE